VKYVLFVCTHNAGRSQMAQALLERHAPPDVRAESAGQEPADRVWPEVVEAMGEIGIDLSGRRPKKLTVEMQLHADWAITLACGGACPYVPTVVEDWEIPDPAGKSLEEVREIRAKPVAPATRRGPQPVLRRQSQIRSCNSSASSRGERCGRLERSSNALTCRPPSSQRCHQRCAVAGETLKAAAAAFSDRPSSIARTNATRPANPSLALACRYIRALL
jgi:arsenate reductase (thioredoxin)